MTDYSTIDIIMISRGAQAPYTSLNERTHLGIYHHMWEFAKKNTSLNKVHLGVISRFAN